MRFTKMHGLGNDFIVVDGKEIDGSRVDARRLCDRHMGIGADGLLLLDRSEAGELSMRLINADGSEAEMCGNGIRCIAKYAFDRKLVPLEHFSIDTRGGLKEIRVFAESGIVEQIEVNMGSPRLLRGEIPVSGKADDTFIEQQITAGGRSYSATCMNMGNPHCVIFVDSFAGISLKDEGSAIETHPLFPAKTNVEFVIVESPARLQVKVWERGAGETLACGTGACASLVAANLCGKAGRHATVALPGGDLAIHWSESGDVFMRGPAREVFSGEIGAETMTL